MNYTAYAIAVMERDLRGFWILAYIGIYSEGATTLTGAFGKDHFSAEIFKCKGENYGQATKNVLSTINNHPLFSWMKAYIR